MAEYSVHPLGLCESRSVGRGTRIWAFAHVLEGARIGEECNLCDHVFVENEVEIGDRVTVKSGVQLWNGVRLEDDVFVGPNATFTNDRAPRSKRYPERFEPTVVERGASVGANATILPGRRIGRGAMVGAGAVVTHDVPAGAIVAGNPARIIGYADATPVESGPPGAEQATVLGRRELLAGRVVAIELRHVADLRGDLFAAELEEVLPFRPKRLFVVANVPSKEVRGEHAHRECEQFLLCVRGTVSLMVDDGETRHLFVLDRPTFGVLVRPMIWTSQFGYSADAALLVLASHRYDPADYIRDYANYCELARELLERGRPE
jgi:acetyltransferase-like isoleucine patch superfamily enzyme